jgi:pantoate--beta-alanine ligase
LRTARTPESVRAAIRACRARGETIGFVPTMGALHIGHRALMRRARWECDRLIVSIFVNPLQFGKGEDYRRYPRPVRRDAAILRDEGVDLLYQPDAAHLYPEGFTTRVSVERLQDPLEGVCRPGHFDGVATVVAKLLIAVEPDCLYLGQKDAQQAAILRRMVADLDFGVRVVVCPTVREPDGLACSSRNAYLTEEERGWAPALHAALREAAAAFRDGAAPGTAAALMRRRLARGPGRLDYAAAVDPDTLEAPAQGGPVLFALAYRLGSARLIDNVVARSRRSR